MATVTILRAQLTVGPVVIPSGTGMEAGAGIAVSAQVSHPPSRSGWLDEAITLLGSAERSPGRSQRKAGFGVCAFSLHMMLGNLSHPQIQAEGNLQVQQTTQGTSIG